MMISATGASPGSASIVALVLLNIVSSTLLVSANKALVLLFDFRFMVLLSGLHFLVGYLALHAASAPECGTARLFERPRGAAASPAAAAALPASTAAAPEADSLPPPPLPPPAEPSLLVRTCGSIPLIVAALVGALSIVLMNYSLRHNSIGSYQMIKVAVLPATIGLSFLQGERVSAADVTSAALVVAGSAIATVTDVGLTAVGSLIGLAAVAATAQYQVAQGRIQRELGLSAPQALHALSLPQAAFTLGASVLLETAWSARLLRGGGAVGAVSEGELAALRAAGALAAVGPAGGASAAVDAALHTSEAAGEAVADLWGHPFSLTEMGLILLTCACAVALNYSGIALIGRISPIGFQFVNQAKTVLIVAAGFLLFSEVADAMRLLSITVGLVCVGAGVIYYTVSRASRSSAPSAAVAAAPTAGVDASLEKVAVVADASGSGEAEMTKRSLL